MTKVVLHGELGRAVGQSVWYLEVGTVQEALRAIEANTSKLYAYLMQKDEGQAAYHVVADKHPLDSIDRFVISGRPPKEINVIPALMGAGGGGMLAIIGVVLVLIAATILTFGVAAPVAGAAAGSAAAAGSGILGLSYGASVMLAGSVLMMGTSMIISGLAQMLSPSEQANKPNKPSYVFNGAENTTRQGVAHPVGYGELIVGSAVISAGLSSVAIPLTNSTTTTGGSSKSK